MNITHLLSRLVIVLTGILPFPLALASPPGPSSDSGTLVITRDGSVKLKSELNSDDIALGAIPFTSTDNGTLTVGSFSGTCPGGGIQSLAGFASGSWGSYSPNGLTGGHTVMNVDDNRAILCTFSSFSILDVSGFSSDPGKSWLSSVTCNGVTNTGTTSSHFYSSGIAEWKWSTVFGLNGKIGSNISCSIVHN